MTSRQFPYTATAKEWLYGHTTEYFDIVATHNLRLSPRAKSRREEMAWRKLHKKFARLYPAPHLSLQEMFDLDFHTEAEEGKIKAKHLKVCSHP